MKSPTLLWNMLADELGQRCGVCTDRDKQTVAVRSEHEGFAFLALALPRFGKDFERSLELGEIAPNTFIGFKTCGGARTPSFLGGFVELVFDRFDGRLIQEPSVDAIHAVRQLTLMYGKVEVRCAEKHVARAIDSYLECEQDVRTATFRGTSARAEVFRQVKAVLWSDVLQRVDKDLYEEERQAGLSTRDPDWPYIRPKHGPGATADRRRGNAKFSVGGQWPRRLETVFSSAEYLLPNVGHHDCLDRVDFPGARNELPTRLVDVPKSLDKPRLIAEEPSWMQFVQQGIKERVVTHIQASQLGAVVGFDDQWRNHRLAQKGSLDGSLATLDLSEASDRVSNQLVNLLLSRNPLTRRAVMACRSLRVDVPGRGVYPLAKFASMGSALTFPIEAMVFATVVFVGIQRSLGRPLTRRDVLNLRDKVRVYGDDIIVPTDYTSSVIEALEDYGLKVNSHKSFWRGAFRESCGKEYYRGEDVSIVRVRKLVGAAHEFPVFPTSRRHAVETESLVNLRNRFYLSGEWRTAAWLDERIGRLLNGRYPRIACRPLDPDKDPEARSRVLGRYTFLWTSVHGVHSERQIPLVRGWVVRTPKPESPADEIGSLRKVLAPRRRFDDRPLTREWERFEATPFEDDDHLQYAGRPDADRSRLRPGISCPL